MNLTHCFSHSQERALKVLKRVQLEQLSERGPYAEHWVVVSGWQNGREQGYLISAWSPKGTRILTVAECRNSDEIVVFEGAAEDFNYTTGLPGDGAKRHFFSIGGKDEAYAEKSAAKFITETLYQHLNQEVA